MDVQRGWQYDGDPLGALGLTEAEFLDMSLHTLADRAYDRGFTIVVKSEDPVEGTPGRFVYTLVPREESSLVFD